MKPIFKALVGSRSYGTDTPTSDTDYKGIYIQDQKEIIGFNYNPQIEIGKDEVYYEIRRFLELAKSANPTILELLYSPKDCIIETSPQYELLVKNRSIFLTKKCLNSFGGYAVAQIKKAKGLDKKMNWESKRVERKTPLDFCYIYEDGKTMPLTKYLALNNLKQEYCGLSALNHFRDCYALYYDYKAKYYDSGNRLTPNNERMNGIIREDSNCVVLSSIPEFMLPECIMYYNKDGYSMHCKDYNEYQTWLANRNTQRYVDNKKHNQKIDGKNMLHCVRLLDMAEEIATKREIIVRRPNAEYLLDIRKGNVNIVELINMAEDKLKKLDELYDKSNLPTDVDNNLVNELLLQVRLM